MTPESLRRTWPKDNEDISLTIPDIDRWLRKIARYRDIITDRAHVMIAAAMLGRKVIPNSNNYHKVIAIWEHSLA